MACDKRLKRFFGRYKFGGYLTSLLLPVTGLGPHGYAADVRDVLLI
jgi:hypothetical protein